MGDMVFIPGTADQATADNLALLAPVGEALITSGACTPVASGETFTPPTNGGCFQFVVSSDSVDSVFGIDATGISGLAVFAQHVPIEFERTIHYFFTASGVDIEPIAEIGGIPYMYFECLDGGLITFGEHCDDCSETFDVDSCGEGAVGVASDGSYCFIVPEENDLVHTVSCSDDNTIAYVNVYVDAPSCDDLSSGITEVHEHASGECEQLAHEHGGDEEEVDEGSAFEEGMNDLVDMAENAGSMIAVFVTIPIVIVVVGIIVFCFFCRGGGKTVVVVEADQE